MALTRDLYSVFVYGDDLSLEKCEKRVENVIRFVRQICKNKATENDYQNGDDDDVDDDDDEYVDVSFVHVMSQDRVHFYTLFLDYVHTRNVNGLCAFCDKFALK